MTQLFFETLKKIKDATGLYTAVFAPDGTVAFRSSGGLTANAERVKEAARVVQYPDCGITVVPLASGHKAVLFGCGEEYRNYAEFIKALCGGAAEPVRELTHAEKLKMYLLGELGEKEAEELARKYSGPFDGYVLTLVTDLKSKLDELRNFLETMRESGDIIVPFDDRSVAFIKRCGEEDEYQSATDFAFTLYDNIKEELRVDFVINVGGTAHSFSELGLYFGHCALAYEFGKMLSPNGKIYSYKEYIMMKLLSEVPRESLARYLDTMLDRDSTDILDDSELMNTAEEFLKNSLNISETSRSMYMHRNTLIYRLDKIEKATGLNLRHFNDAVAFRLLTILNKLVKNKQGTDKRKGVN